MKTVDLRKQHRALYQASSKALELIEVPDLPSSPSTAPSSPVRPLATVLAVVTAFIRIITGRKIA